jgi:hypothetical protein
MICKEELFVKMMKKFGTKDLEDGLFLNQIKHFTRYDWLRNQSFCMGKEYKLRMIERLTKNGLCFIFNENPDLLADDM